MPPVQPLQPIVPLFTNILNTGNRQPDLRRPLQAGASVQVRSASDLPVTTMWAPGPSWSPCGARRSTSRYAWRDAGAPGARGGPGSSRAARPRPPRTARYDATCRGPGRGRGPPSGRGLEQLTLPPGFIRLRVHSRVAQLVEQVAVNHRVAGSSPAAGAGGPRTSSGGFSFSEGVGPTLGGRHRPMAGASAFRIRTPGS